MISFYYFVGVSLTNQSRLLLSHCHAFMTGLPIPTGKTVQPTCSRI